MDLRRGVLMGGLLVTGACARSPLVDADDVVTWANTGSALAVWSTIDGPVAFAVGHESFEDAACPATTDDGTTVTITGGCTDDAGVEWVGEVVIDRAGGSHDLDLSFDGYGSAEADPATTKGSARVRELGDDLFSFDVDIVHEGGIKTTIDYAGTVAGNYDAPTTWNGAGDIGREGLVAPTGTVKMHTDDAHWDGAICSGQALSGTTTIEADGHEVVVTYDGETDCDDEHAARWSVDGEDRGTVDGITCRVGAEPSAFTGLLVGLGLFGRRRRARARASRPRASSAP